MRRALPAVVVAGILWGCSSGNGIVQAPTERPSAVRKLSGDGQVAITSTRLSTAPTIEVVDSAGRPLSGVQVAFNVIAGDGWVVSNQQVTDNAGRASAIWYLGPVSTDSQQLEARVGPLTARFHATSVRPTSGTVIAGENSYIEWIAGDLPIVLTAPHGGTMLPAEIPDRTSGTTTRDLNTDDLAVEVAAAFEARYGMRPHLVICRLSRRKLDANREIVEAAAGNAAAERAWREYHGFIEASTSDVRQRPGIGFYIDLHGHGHAIQRLELGYLLSASVLALSDAQLALNLTTQSSSLWSVALATGTPIAALIRGSSSLGALFESAGYPSVPSATTPSPGMDPYFEGGYSTQRHAAAADRRFAGVQIEAHLDGVRDTAAHRAAFATALVNAVGEFMRVHGLAGLERASVRRGLEPLGDLKPAQRAKRAA